MHWAFTELLPLVGATREKARIVKHGYVNNGYALSQNVWNRRVAVGRCRAVKGRVTDLTPVARP